MKRHPAVAGQFYPGIDSSLKKELENLVLPGRKKEKAVSIVSPHAGYEYSGMVAGAVYSSVQLPQTIVILGPNHRGGRPSRFAIMRAGSWVSPLGEVAIEAGLADLLLAKTPLIQEDEGAHAQEHSLEVQVPFLQYFQKGIRIVPICLYYHARYQDLEELGKAMASAIRDFGQEALIVASTDMSHFVSQKTARRNDFLAIDKILALDPAGLYEIVQERDISMCGFQAVAAALVASKLLGAKKAELIQYQTSGDRTGDYSSVVGYAGVRIL